MIETFELASGHRLPRRIRGLRAWNLAAPLQEAIHAAAAEGFTSFDLDVDPSSNPGVDRGADPAADDTPDAPASAFGRVNRARAAAGLPRLVPLVVLDLRALHDAGRATPPAVQAQVADWLARLHVPRLGLVWCRGLAGLGAHRPAALRTLFALRERGLLEAVGAADVEVGDLVALHRGGIRLDAVRLRGEAGAGSAAARLVPFAVAQRIAVVIEPAPDAAALHAALAAPGVAAVIEPFAAPGVAAVIETHAAPGVAAHPTPGPRA
jgi:hypothetical protein